MKQDIENWFSYHAPTMEQLPNFEMLRLAGKHFAETVLVCCPPGQDAYSAIQYVRSAVMLANAAIACAPRVMAGKPQRPMTAEEQKEHLGGLPKDSGQNIPGEY